MDNSEILGFQFEPNKALQPDSSSDERLETCLSAEGELLGETMHQLILGACVSAVVNTSNEGVLVLS